MVPARCLGNALQGARVQHSGGPDVDLAGALAAHGVWGDFRGDAFETGDAAQ